MANKSLLKSPADKKAAQAAYAKAKAEYHKAGERLGRVTGRKPKK